MSKQAFKRLRKHLKLEVNRKPLPAYAWPGGYPIFYVCDDGGCLCPKCVNKEIEQIDESVKTNARDGWRVDAADINYEDANLYCDNCNEFIEAAYVD